MDTVVQQLIEWTKKKIRHNLSRTSKQLYSREKEIWWVALGKNIGFEIDGKHELFERPVLIIKKYSEDMCFIIPLTTIIKSPQPWYQVHVVLQETKSALNITQGRTISSKRFLRKIEVLETHKYNEAVQAFTNQFILK